MSKYQALRTFLSERGGDFVPMTFGDIEKVLGFKLPESQKYPAWWSNNPTNNVMTNEWLAAGYKTEQVDTERRKLVFKRVRPTTPAVARGTDPGRGSAAEPEPRRHPGFGLMKGLTTIAPGTDLTAPTGGDWGSAE